MVDKDKSGTPSDTETGEDASTDDATPSTKAASAPDVEVEEVEAEIVDAAEIGRGDGQTTSEDAAATIGDPAADGEGAIKGAAISPGVVFLGALGLIGAIAAGLFAIRGDKTAQTPSIAETKIETPAAAQSIGAPETGAIDEVAKAASTKIANTQPGSTKDALAAVDIDAIPEATRGSLPSAPAVQNASANGNSELQKAAKAAAAQLIPERIEDSQPVADQLKDASGLTGAKAGDLVNDVTEKAEAVIKGAASDGQSIAETVGAKAVSPQDSVTPKNSTDIAKTVIDAPKTQIVENGEAGLGQIASNAEGVIAETGTQDIVEAAQSKVASNEDASNAVKGAVVEGVKDEVEDPVADAADLFASNPQASETPADQLGADPIQAIQSLQEDAAARAQDVDGAGDVVEEIAGDGVEAVTAAATPNAVEDAATVVANAPASAEAVEGQSTVAATAESVVSENAPAPIETAPIEQLAEVKDGTSEVVETITAPTATETRISEGISAQAGQAAISSVPVATGPSAEAVAEKFAGEIAALEQNFEDRTTEIAAALEAERQRAAEQSEKIAQLERNLDEALRANEERNSAEISQLENSIEELKATEQRQTSTTERQTAGLLALISLQRTFDQGSSYRRELNVLQSALPNAVDYIALGRVADEGSPTIATLKEEFNPALRSTLANGGGSEPKGFVGQLMRNLQALVSVRPAEPTSGDGVPETISRAENKIDREDLGGAISEIESLGAAVSPEMQTWLERARQHHEAAAQIGEINEKLLAGVTRP